MRIILGIIGIILSFLLLIYREPVKNFFGTIQWAEEHLGSGGTYTLMILVSLVGFIFSLMYMTNSFDLLFGGVGVSFFDTAK